MLDVQEVYTLVLLVYLLYKIFMGVGFISMLVLGVRTLHALSYMWIRIFNVLLCCKKERLTTLCCTWHVNMVVFGIKQPKKE